MNKINHTLEVSIENIFNSSEKKYRLLVQTITKRGIQ